jgi:hypothetical protein
MNESNIYEIECKKMSGASNWGYGMIFGASNTDMRRYYDLGISTQGYYIIGKKVNEEYTTIRDWTKSEKLNTGYNTINTLKVVKNGTTFTVYLNGSQADQFTDTEISGDRIGYWVDIGLEKDESFPNTPVDVRFRQKNGSGGGDSLANQHNGTWKAGYGTEIKFKNGSFEIAQNVLAAQY